MAGKSRESHAMRVLIFCTANLGIGTGSGIRARLITEGLVQCGAKIWLVSAGAPDHFYKSEIGISSFENPASWESTLRDAAHRFEPEVALGITEAGTDIVLRVSQGRYPVIFDLHGIGVIEVMELGKGYGSRLPRILRSAKWLSKIPRADAITVVNPSLVPIFSILNRAVTPIIGMVDIDRFSPDGPSKSLGQDDSSVQVLYAGNFLKWQGVDLLIEAIDMLINSDEPFEFTLLGPMGKKTEYFRDKIRSFDQKRVHLEEPVDYELIPEYYRAADVLVIPRPRMISTYMAFPQKLVEYMASGSAIVATDLKPHRWALSHSRSAILCPPTPAGIADGLRELKDPATRDRISRRARRRAEQEFSHVIQAQRMINLFEYIRANH